MSLKNYVEPGYVDSSYYDGQGQMIEHHSLNGAHGSLPDGQKVLVSGYANKYVVVNSYFFKTTDTDYSIMYTLKDENDKIAVIPSGFVYLEKPEDNSSGG